MVGVVVGLKKRGLLLVLELEKTTHTRPPIHTLQLHIKAAT
jgi:hypothetical protein